MELAKDILLSDYTTISLGGAAKYFAVCSSLEDIKEALSFGRKKNLIVQVIAGGSNIIFSDGGYKGLILKIDLKGIQFEDEKDFVKLKVNAGENWDDFVKLCIDNDLAGIECLSGIPGTIGATPIQNVGAYGQEISDTMVSLKAIDKNTFDIVNFKNDECKFEYRKSRFKTTDKDKYVITEVTFCLKKFAQPEIKYPELQKHIESNFDFSSLSNGKEKLNKVRQAVIELRKKKSMIIDKNDPNSKSCGSFFMNPVLSKNEFEILKNRVKSNSNNNFPFFEMGESYKIPAAWLVEQAGFHKGYKKNGAGISSKHSLAIINCGGTTKDVLNLANEIGKKVYGKFGVALEKEPEVIK